MSAAALKDIPASELQRERDISFRPDLEISQKVEVDLHLLKVRPVSPGRHCCAPTNAPPPPALAHHLSPRDFPPGDHPVLAPYDCAHRNHHPRIHLDGRHHQRRRRIHSCFELCILTFLATMPPRGTTAVKAKVARLPPLPHLRVKTPNITNANPCNTDMASVLSMSSNAPT